MGHMRLAIVPAALAALCLVVAAQPPASRFNVVSLRPASASEQPTGFTHDPERLTVSAQTLRWLILQAYALREDQLTGGPAWVSAQRFTLTATTSSPATRAEMMHMLQGVLAN